MNNNLTSQERDWIIGGIVATLFAFILLMVLVNSNRSSTDTPLTQTFVAGLPTEPFIASATPSPTDTPTITPTPTDTLTPTEPNPLDIAAQMIQTEQAATAIQQAEDMTASATYWTSSPTADSTQTEQILTEVAQGNLETAIATLRTATQSVINATQSVLETQIALIPTAISTPSPTPVESNTPSSTSTSTPAPTSEMAVADSPSNPATPDSASLIPSTGENNSIVLIIISLGAMGIGLISCFAGVLRIQETLFLIGIAVGIYLGLASVAILNNQFVVTEFPPITIVSVFVSIIFGVITATLFYMIFDLAVIVIGIGLSLGVGYIIVMGFNIQLEGILAIIAIGIVGVIGAIIGFILRKTVKILATSFGGAALLVYGLTILLPDLGVGFIIQRLSLDMDASQFWWIAPVLIGGVGCLGVMIQSSYDVE